MEKLKFTLKFLIFPIWFTLVGILISLTSINYKIGNASSPGAGFFPFLVGIGLVILGIIEGFPWMKVKLEKNNLEKPINLNVVALVSTLILWPALLNYAGYILTTFLFIFITARLFGLEGPKKAILLALSTTMLVYLFFKVLFYLDLPSGLVINKFLNL